MAGVSSKEIKNRIRSLESTKQITKAMEMVASSKLRQAQAQVLASRPYFLLLRQAIDQIAAGEEEFSSPYLTQRSGDRVVYVVIAGDRGLAGGYNNNLFKLVLESVKDQNATILPIGKKTAEYFSGKNFPVLTREYAQVERITPEDCAKIARDLCDRYRKGEFDRIAVAYTVFASALSQIPETLQILPLHTSNARGGSRDVIYEPDRETVFEAVVPEYVGGVLFGAVRESRASEHAARRAAMDAATDNASQMIDDLQLQFNRARQAAITQEITEIVAGS
ncbi:MAG: ATP synthase F1 subunit gamma [Oscillospiraceae bacterium]|nr:ATP synthase F1 subunit gamma [Oscillospiraceae bacterium]